MCHSNKQITNRDKKILKPNKKYTYTHTQKKQNKTQSPFCIDQLTTPGQREGGGGQGGIEEETIWSQYIACKILK